MIAKLGGADRLDDVPCRAVPLPRFSCHSAGPEAGRPTPVGVHHLSNQWHGGWVSFSGRDGPSVLIGRPDWRSPGGTFVMSHAFSRGQASDQASKVRPRRCRCLGRRVLHRAHPKVAKSRASQSRASTSILAAIHPQPPSHTLTDHAMAVSYDVTTRSAALRSYTTPLDSTRAVCREVAQQLDHREVGTVSEASAQSGVLRSVEEAPRHIRVGLDGLCLGCLQDPSHQHCHAAGMRVGNGGGRGVAGPKSRYGDVSPSRRSQRRRPVALPARHCMSDGVLKHALEDDVGGVAV